MKTQKQRLGYILLLVLAAVLFTGLFVMQPIMQDIHYHSFSDERSYIGVPNFWNVLSNVPFIIIGCSGVYKLKVKNKLTIVQESRIAYIVFFTGIFLTGLGSAYYHLHPENNTLVWDRIPMTITFMSLFSIVITEFISVNNGKKILFPFVFIGAMSVLHWYCSEQFGAGDLRYYAMIQFYPMLAIPIILSCFNSRFTHTKLYWLLFLSYSIAKLCEQNDVEIHQSLRYVSGHSLKHIIAATGLYGVLYGYERRGVIKKKIII